MPANCIATESEPFWLTVLFRHRSFIFVIGLSFLSCVVSSQSFTIKAFITDATTGELLPFATVYNIRSGSGTASNAEGFFQLPNIVEGDSLRISYLGYRVENRKATSLFPDTVFLQPVSSALDEIIVSAQSDYLYDMIVKIKSNFKTRSRVAKTYFLLETKLGGETAEIIESFYNGTISNMVLSDLQLKKGRIGVKPVNNRYFYSTSSSRLFTKHDLFNRSKYFPDSPFSIRKNDLKSTFSLSLQESYFENGSRICVIAFTPVHLTGEQFHGRIWINADKNQLLKIEMEIEEAKVHPFIPIGFNTIESVDIRISKNFEIIQDEGFINSIDFDYRTQYVDKWGNKVEAYTAAYMKAYDYMQAFQLPLFEFTSHLHEDYRNIQASQYDTAFWNRTDEFRFYDRLEEIEEFIHENKMDERILRPNNKQDSLHSQLQFPYIKWSSERFIMEQAKPEVLEKAKFSSSFETDKYNLDAKIYLDVNRWADTITFQAVSVIDPVNSFYHFPIEGRDLAFINMYFDLLEIQRRELAAELDTHLVETLNLSPDVVQFVYTKHKEEAVSSWKKFTGETNRGRNKRAMKKWNQYIFEKLGIDNLAFFAGE